MHSTRIAELGITFPDVAAPVAAYVPARQVGNQVWTSGQLPFVDGVLPATGKVGAEISPEDAATYARQAVLNALAAVDALVGIDAVTASPLPGPAGNVEYFVNMHAGQAGSSGDLTGDALTQETRRAVAQGPAGAGGRGGRV